MLLPLTLAFLFGLLLGSYVPFLPLTITGILLLVAMLCTLLERSGKLEVRQGGTLFGVLLAGVLYWNVFAWATNDSSLLRFIGAQPVMMKGMVVEPVRGGPERTVLVVSVSEIRNESGANPVRGRVRLTWRGRDREVFQGDIIVMTARLRPPTGMMNPGGFDYAAYLERQGIEAVASVSGPGRITVEERRAGPLWSVLRSIDEWRDRIRRAALVTLPQPAAGILLGMIIGEADDVPPAIRDLFMATGTVHILSISGSHLGLIAVSVFFVIRAVTRRLPERWLLTLSLYVTPTRLAVLLTVPVLVFYTVLAGAQVATVRSLVMILLFLLAVWLGRDNKLLWTLATAAWVILLADPKALFDISFQLSFTSVLAIALLAPRHDDDELPERGRDERWWLRGWAWSKEYLWLSIGITLATVPLVAYYFNQMAWLGVLANLLVVPLAGFVLVPLGLASAIWALIIGSTTFPLAGWNQAVSDLIVGLVRLFAALPGAEWHVASPSVCAILLFYLILLVVTYARRPRWLRPALAPVLGVMLLWWAWSPRLSDGHDLHVTFLDVGQGDASVIELPDGQTILIDGGAAYDRLDMGRAVVAPYLWDRGIRRIDHIIATHPQLDHVGGLASLVEKFEVGEYWSNGTAREEAFYQRLTSALQAHQVTDGRVWQDMLLVESGGCRLRVLNPPRGGNVLFVASAHAGGSDLNNQSVVTRLDCGPHSILFPGDIETPSIDRLRKTDDVFNARIMKVPHHGARSSLDPVWIAEAHPELAVISVGRTNPYGHPAGSVLAAFQHQHVRILRTDEDGAIRIHANLGSREFIVERTRDGVIRRLRGGPFDAQAWDVERDNLTKLWRQWASPA